MELLTKARSWNRGLGPTFSLFLLQTLHLTKEDSYSWVTQRFHIWLAPKHLFEKCYAFQLLHICISGVLGLGHFCTSRLLFLIFLSCSSHLSTVLTTRVKYEIGYVLFKNVWTPLYCLQMGSKFICTALLIWLWPSSSSSLPLPLSKQLQVNGHTASSPAMHSLLIQPPPFLSGELLCILQDPSQMWYIKAYIKTASTSANRVDNPFHWAITASLWVSLSQEVSHCSRTTGSHTHLPP